MQMDRSAHLAWAKERALEYCDAGDPQQAFASMGSDLHKHPLTDPDPMVMMVGLGILMSTHDDAAKTAEMRRWIEGYR